MRSAKFAQKAMGTSDGRLDVKFNKHIWTRGVRTVPTRVCFAWQGHGMMMRLQRRSCTHMLLLQRCHLKVLGTLAPRLLNRMIRSENDKVLNLILAHNHSFCSQVLPGCF
ncbi:hypothetical protein CY35_10G009200 [Sphagnum magellanicum]|nr:hypothetical protein CY35_10G009200 [Sphagnum magellanicum]